MSTASRYQIGDVALLKIDVEDGECLALQSAQEFLRANRKVVPLATRKINRR
jgi:hypothetical protein